MHGDGVEVRGHARIGEYIQDGDPRAARRGVAARKQGSDEFGADEASTAGDKYTHGYIHSEGSARFKVAIPRVGE
ncbi:hypothetical protein GCM10009753_04960 [Streptantibioticus ferralitis]